jgi:CubicO group peptidase (beta-lactamase class C family)
MTRPDSVQALQILNNGGYLIPGEADSRAAHAAVMGAIGGISNARGLAQLYRPLALGGAYNGLLPALRDPLPMMGAVESAGYDEVTLTPTRFSLGFLKSIDNMHLAANDREGVLMSEEAFGHAGMGGSLGFADPKARMSFGYAMNRLGLGLGVNSRGQVLVDAVYRGMAYRPTGGGTWYAS